LRSELATELQATNPEDREGRSYYASIGNGAVAEMGAAVPDEFGLHSLQSLLNSNESVGEAVVFYTSIRLRKSIYIINSLTRDVYVTPELPLEQSSIILWYTPGHYDLLALQDSNGELITHFSPQHPVIRALHRRLQEIKRGSSNPKI